MIKEFFEELFEFIKQVWCGLFIGHEKECSDIHKGTFCELSCWCKNCGKPL